MWQVIYYIVVMLVSYYVSSQMMKKQRGADPLNERDVDIPQVSEGTPQAILHGDCWSAGWTVLGWGNVRNQGVKKHDQVAFYKYYMSILMGLWRGPINGIRCITANETIIWQGWITGSTRTYISAENAFGGQEKQGGVLGQMDVAFGNFDQAVNQRAVTLLQHGLPAFRGRTTIFYDGLIAANSLSPYAWLVRGHRTTAGWADGAWYPETCEIMLRNDHDDVGGNADLRNIHAKNGVHILYEAMTNPLWGKGKDPSLLDEARWRNAADTCFDEKLGLCSTWNVSDDVDSYMQKVCDHIGAGVYTSILTGKIAVRLLRKDYNPDLLPVFSPGSGLLSIESIEETSLSEAVSEIIVNWKDPVTNQPRSTRQQNLGLLQSAPVVSKSADYPYLPTVELANRIAARDLQAQGLGMRRYSLTLDRSGATLEPGDVIAINSPVHGIIRDVLRVLNLDYGSSDEGHVSVVASQDVFGLPSDTYALPQGSVWTPPPVAPGVISDYQLFEQHYRDLAAKLGQPTVDALPAGSGYVSSVAVAPTSACTRYDVQSKRANEKNFTLSSDQGSYTTRGIVSGSVFTRQTVDVTLGDVDPAGIPLDSLVLWDGEITQVAAVAGQTVTLRRGCVDTVPAEHSAGSYLWFYDNQTGDVDRSFVKDETVAVRMLSYAGTVSIDPELETEHPFTITGRIRLPYPPRQVKVAGLPFGEGTLVTGGDLVTWAASNRLTQGAAIFAHDDVEVAAEPGTTYNLVITDSLGATVLDQRGLAVQSVALPATPTGFDVWTVRLWSTRGGLDSLQQHVFALNFGNAVRMTSAGRARGTSQGGVRAITH